MPNTEIYDAQVESRKNTSRLMEANVVSGEVEFAVIPYTLTALGSDHVVNLCLLPAGVIPLPQLTKVTCSEKPFTTTGTLGCSVGAGPGGNSAWFNEIELGEGGQVEATSSNQTAPWLVPTPLVPDAGSGNATVRALLSPNAAMKAGVILYFTLAYKRGR